MSRLPKDVHRVRLGNLAYRGMTLEIAIQTAGVDKPSAAVDGKPAHWPPRIDVNGSGVRRIDITLPRP